MKRKIIYAALLAATLGAGAYAADKAAELKKLEESRAAITWKLVDKRADVIANDENCRKLHEQIMSLHRELADKLDANPEIHELNRKAEELDRQIAELKK